MGLFKRKKESSIERVKDYSVDKIISRKKWNCTDCNT